MGSTINTHKKQGNAYNIIKQDLDLDQRKDELNWTRGPAKDSRPAMPLIRSSSGAQKFELYCSCFRARRVEHRYKKLFDWTMTK